MGRAGLLSASCAALFLINNPFLSALYWLHNSCFRCTRSEDSATKARLKEARQRATPEAKMRTRKTIRVGCTFKFNFSYLNRKQSNDPVNPDKRVFVTKASFAHTAGCCGDLNYAVARYTFNDPRQPRDSGRRFLPPENETNDGPKSYGCIVNQLRPLASVLAKHPQQESFLAQLNCIMEIAKRTLREGGGDATSTTDATKTSESAEGDSSKVGGNESSEVYDA